MNNKNSQWVAGFRAACGRAKLIVMESAQKDLNTGTVIELLAELEKQTISELPSDESSCQSQASKDGSAE